MSQIPFIPGETYRRSDIHEKFGGNYQSGISPSAKYPYIFIFTSKTGHQNGYEDRWENEDVFSYTGEGQVGDMKFVKGNLALLEHVRIGKRVFLFVQKSKGFVEFEEELKLLESDYFPAIDRNGKERQAIRFFFQRVNARVNYKIGPDLTPPSLDSISSANIPNKTERAGLIVSRVGQGAYRKRILYRWKFKCAVTGFSNLEILIASHIVAWKDSSDKERLDVENGILLSPIYDALFDRHLISFENNGKIIISLNLSKYSYQVLGVTGKEAIKNLSDGNRNYLDKHRKVMNNLTQ